jgi:nudix-type nucleoside diphosphatase (YffH/AdpP family)
VKPFRRTIAPSRHTRGGAATRGRNGDAARAASGVQTGVGVVVLTLWRPPPCGLRSGPGERGASCAVPIAAAEGTGMDERGRVEVEGAETLAEDWNALRKYRLAYRRRDGTRQTLSREVYFNGPGAAVLPFDPRRGTVLLTRQFRLAAQLNGEADPWLVEACAGNVEPGDDPAETARKEAEQETGHRLRELRRAFALYTSPGACAEVLHLFTATYGPAERSGAGGGLREEGEEIEVLELPLEEAWAMVGRGEIADAKTVLLLQHLMLTRARGASPREP